MLELTDTKFHVAPYQVWRSRDGKAWAVRKMHTTHCFHCLRVVYNYVAKATERLLVPGGNHYIMHMSSKEIRRWLMVFIIEIEVRKCENSKELPRKPLPPHLAPLYEEILRLLGIDRNKLREIVFNATGYTHQMLPEVGTLLE